MPIDNPCCLRVHYKNMNGAEVDFDLTLLGGTLNENATWEWTDTFYGVTYMLYFDHAISVNSWVIYETTSNTIVAVMPLREWQCPTDTWEVAGTPTAIYGNLYTIPRQCDTVALCCIQFNFRDAGTGEVFSFSLSPNSSGEYIFVFQSSTYTLAWMDNGGTFEWCVYSSFDNEIIYSINLPLTEEDCPIAGDGEWRTENGYRGILIRPFTVLIGCEFLIEEEREFAFYPNVDLPTSNVEDDFGLNECCCRELVLANNGGETWENDITPVWIKMSGDASNSFSFKLLKNGVPTGYIFPMQPIVKEEYGFYSELSWADVLASYGVGCYTIVLDYLLSGINGQKIWGQYMLQTYSQTSALYTARVRAIFNSYHVKENIDFTDTNMQGTLRFNGFIGKRQPNTEIDNIIYGNREMKSVIRENINSYEIGTDPLDFCILNPLIDLYLLHENQLFISDYNFHNHSYQYKDVPCILTESPDIEYYDWSRKASLTAKVGDKIRNDQNYYK